MKRSSGILLPISALSSPYGIGTFGKEAYNFVDFLNHAGQKHWQVLPLGPTGFGDSPYQSFSTFAGNPYFIDFDFLKSEGLLEEDDYTKLNWGDFEAEVDYGLIYKNRFKVLEKAYQNGWSKSQSKIDIFIEKHKEWINDYAFFMAIKEHFGMVSLMSWPDQGIRRRDPVSMDQYWHLLKDRIQFWVFVQYHFFRQWGELKRYANRSGVRIIGDLPIYVALDSADVWSQPELFELDDDGIPTAVSGCPPDYFSEDGQLWGNPLCRWEQHRSTAFAWWGKRLSSSLKLFDELRIDHFRGFDSYYTIPSDHKNARNGTWLRGPGMELIHALKEFIGEGRIIAEDLGFLTKDVQKMLKDSGFPGMKVLQFAFDPNGHSEYLPHKYPANCVVYTGTHDNNTAIGWFNEGDPHETAFAQKYLIETPEEGFNWAMIRGAWGSPANLAVAPMQDFLGLGSDARMNTPSTAQGNWRWRLDARMLTEALSSKIKTLTELHCR